MSLTPNQLTTFKAKHVRGAERLMSCTEAGCQKRENGWLVVLAIPAQQDMIGFIRAGNTHRYYIEKVFVFIVFVILIHF